MVISEAGEERWDPDTLFHDPLSTHTIDLDEDRSGQMPDKPPRRPSNSKRSASKADAARYDALEAVSRDLENLALRGPVKPLSTSGAHPERSIHK